MFKWLKAFHKTLVAEGKEWAQFTYGSISLLIFVVIGTVAKILNNETIACISIPFGVIGLLLWILYGYNDSKEDVKKFFKKVKKNMK